MISLRKHMDEYRPRPQHSGLDAFRSSLLAIAQCSERAVPSLGSELNVKLNRIAAKVDDKLLPQATAEMRTELTNWADRALEQHEENEREIREIIGTVATAAESLSQNGDKYARRIGDLTGKLRSLANINDVSVIRRSIIENAHALNTCVEQMAEDRKASVYQLTCELTEYRDRLHESEQASTTDCLTGLANRRGFERKLHARIATGQGFCLIMLDMNAFKAVNDTYGHLAGDELLKQFASELRGHFTSADVVSRWGGDEFAIIVAAGFNEAEDRVDRIERFVCGEYRLTSVHPPVTVNACAAIGLVQWNGEEDSAQVVARADKETYLAKTTFRPSSKAPGAKSP